LRVWCSIALRAPAKLGMVLILGMLHWCALAAQDRAELEPGVSAVIRGGRMIFLECHLPQGEAAKELLKNYLADADGWQVYKNRTAVAIPYTKLSADAQRKTLQALFPDDYVDEQGWWHIVKYTGADGVESWWSLAEWFTGAGPNQVALRTHEKNAGLDDTLKTGQKILIPMNLLPEVFRIPVNKEQAAEDTSVIFQADSELTYGSDKKGEYAEYVLKKGETLFSGVAGRFTDFHEDKDILVACMAIQKRSGIKDARKAAPGQKILIPMDLLSDRYKPQSSQERQEYEAVDQEARKLAADRVKSKDLEGVVIILDPGHGGRDQGAAVKALGLFEDEVNYDVVCRIKRVLETKTRATVYVTMKDPDQGYKESGNKQFVHDTDEQVLTTPPYWNEDARFSAHLRWYLVNDIHRGEMEKKTDPRKMLFTSIHCDFLKDGGMRGTMIYVPGAKYRMSNHAPSGPEYNRYAEAKGQGNVRFTQAECTRDEALSRLFATTLTDCLTRHTPPIKVHSSGNPIRNVIKQSANRTFVPAVLKYSYVPAKVLIEIANLNNPTDQQRLADPQWRQAFAEAYVAAVKKYFGN